MKIGYVRVSKQEQNEELQIDALKEAGCDKWFVDKIPSSRFEELHHAHPYLHRLTILQVAQAVPVHSAFLIPLLQQDVYSHPYDKVIKAKV